MTASGIRYTTSLDGIGTDDLGGGFWDGWPSPPTADQHLAMLHGSEAVVLAIDVGARPGSPGRVVGFVTAVGDGVLAAYLPALEVLPDWRGQGIGSELVRRVLAQLEPRYMVDLVCDEELVPFYERLGLRPHLARRPEEEASHMSVTRDDVQRWLDRYVEAWRTYDVQAIGELFAEDATYRYHPYDREAIIGRSAIVADWRENQDAPGSWTAHYEPYAVERDRAVAIGESRYTKPDGSLRDLYYNLWTLRFDDAGRCTDFVEYFMALPDKLKADG